MSFKLKFEKHQKLLRILNTASRQFMSDVAKRWRLDGQLVIAQIVRTQLTGRPGLNRVSGNASRALNTKTMIKGKDVVQKFFINQSNPAKTYLPMHDKSRKGNGIIKARIKPYLTFKTRDGHWHSVKKVKIPIRTDILGVIEKLGNKKRAASVNAVLRSYK